MKENTRHILLNTEAAASGIFWGTWIGTGLVHPALGLAAVLLTAPGILKTGQIEMERMDEEDFRKKRLYTQTANYEYLDSLKKQSDSTKTKAEKPKACRHWNSKSQ